MKNNYILRSALVAVVCTVSMGAMQEEVFKKHDIEVLNRKVADRLRRGHIAQIRIHPSWSSTSRDNFTDALITCEM